MKSKKFTYILWNFNEGKPQSECGICHMEDEITATEKQIGKINKRMKKEGLSLVYIAK